MTVITEALQTQIEYYEELNLKVFAIKALREETGLGLKESKGLIDRVWKGEEVDSVFVIKQESFFSKLLSLLTGR